MHNSRLDRYRRAHNPLPQTHLAWPLYGKGLESLGRDGQPVRRPLPTFGSEELLVRHDAVGFCYTDVKEIQLGPEHPRLLGRDLASDPIVPGHEASITVVAVGASLRTEYHVGDRFVIQPDVWYEGKSVPYSFGMDGAFRQYAAIGKEILHGDAGNYLIPVSDSMTYAGAALTEPWACVEASYRISYRTRLHNEGRACFIGGTRSGYHIDAVWGAGSSPAEVVASGLPADLLVRVRQLCEAHGASLQQLSFEQVMASGAPFDDIVLLDGDAPEVDAAATMLAKGGILAILRKDPMSGPIHLDLGRVHYDHIVYVGTTSLGIDRAYQDTPVRAALKPEGIAWILGAGGPMGRMHLQRAIQVLHPPGRIIATNRGLDRLDDLRRSFSALARARAVELVAVSPREEHDNYLRVMEQALRDGGVSDVEVMAPGVEAVVQAADYAGPGAVINLFAGLKRGEMAAFDAWKIYGPTQLRIVGHSGSGLKDQETVVQCAEGDQLQPERSVAAVCGLQQVPDGIQAMIAKTYPGKIVVYPMVVDFPLTALGEFAAVLPQVHACLGDGESWTAAAEAAFLEAMLPE